MGQTLDTFSQVPIVDSDSLNRIRDSITHMQRQRDSLKQVEMMRLSKLIDTSVYNHHPFFGFKSPRKLISTERQHSGKEGFFYAIVALLLLFALLKNQFSRYLSDLSRVFFRTTLKQRQTKDQLMGAPLPSLMFNIMYAISAGLFITLLLRHFRLGLQYDFWLLFAYAIAGLLVVYSIKYITLKIFGWILHMSEATDNYIFIVFTTNKIIGIALLPFIVGLAFMSGDSYSVVFFLSIGMLALLFVYRFYLSYVSVQKQIRINFFHFIIYLVALEIAPLLLINKLLLRFF